MFLSASYLPEVCYRRDERIFKGDGYDIYAYRTVDPLWMRFEPEGCRPFQPHEFLWCYCFNRSAEQHASACFYFDNSCMRFPAVFVWGDRYYVKFPVSAGPVTVKDHVTMFPQIGTGDIFSITSELMRRHRSYWAVRGPFAVLCRIYRLIVRFLQYWLSHTSTSPQCRQPRRIKTAMWSNREHASKTVNLVCVSISGKV